MKRMILRCKVLKMIKPENVQSSTSLEDLLLDQDKNCDFAETMETLWKAQNDAEEK